MASATPPLAILLAEDEAASRELTAFILEAEGYRVITAANGSLAFNLLVRDDSIDLVISDINMPGGMDGIELVRRAHDAGFHATAILTSGHDQGSYANYPREVPFLPKPYDRRTLLAAVRAIAPGR